jgi:site-specific DNA-methyltransferase (adenine-specific)
MRTETIAEGVELHPGDCMAILPQLAEGSVDSCVTDPPYHLTNNAGTRSPGQYTPIGQPKKPKGGFMGKQWDGGETAFEPETWAAVYRVLKPGGHLLAFGAPKNFGFMQYAISQAGFEIRDVIAWIFGSGFPKSHNLPGGFGTALKPAYEPIIMARKPLTGTVAANVQEHGTGALNIDGCRVGVDDAEPNKRRATGDNGGADSMFGVGNSTRPETLANGRWPANVIHDGSEEVVGAFPHTASRQDISVKQNSSAERAGNKGAAYGRESRPAGSIMTSYGDEGSASRFFYTAKADADDRLGSKHPTVKPLDLMQYLVRLVTPPKGLVLDPFAGTGTTGEAAIREGMRAVLIEREPEYQDDIRRRMKLAMSGPDERARESIKAKTKDKPADHGPLFADLWKEPYWNEDGTAPAKAEPQ